MDRSDSLSPVQSVLREALASALGSNERKSEPERRPSTIIDENGTIVQRGFLIPNRTSPPRSRTSRPASPMYNPIIGFARPTGSLYDVPELRALVKKSPASFHRPTKSAGDLHDPASRKTGLGDRRQTWQSGATSAVWTVDELAQISTRKPDTAPPWHQNVKPTATMPPQTTDADVRRSSRAQQDLQTLSREQPNRDAKLPQYASNQQQASSKSLKEDIKAATQAEAEDAIASDSEDDDDVFTPQPKRPSYAERRMRQDERAAEDFNRHVEAYASQVQQQVSEPMRALQADQHESAIESDDEIEDHRVAASLRMAKLHRTHNMITTSQAAPETEIERSRTNEPAEGEGGRRTSLSVKITPHSLPKLKIDGSAKDGVTPREIKSFETDAPIPCRKLRPSKSRPRPAKGVLKKTDSPPSSSSSNESSPKHVQTQAAKRSSFAKCRDAVMPYLIGWYQPQTYWPKQRP